MLYKILISIILFGFVAACSTTPNDTGDASGTGSSGDFNQATSSESDDASSGDASASITPGSKRRSYC